MPFDALTLSAVRQELQDKLVGGRVQNVIMPGPLAVSLEIYRAGTGRTHLLLSAHAQHARVHLTSAAPTRDPEQHAPLLLLLRKYVRGGTIIDVSQPRFERVLTLSIAKRLPPDKHQEYHFEGDFRHKDQQAAVAKNEVQSTKYDEGPLTTDDQRPMDDDLEEEDDTLPVRTIELIVEVMGRVSNIVMVEEDGTVMESIKRVPSSINRYRVILPHHLYVPPPPQDKRDPTRTTINALSLELARSIEDPTTQNTKFKIKNSHPPAWQGLVNGYAAVSPALAREVMFRALGDTKAPAAEVASRPAALTRVLEELQKLFRTEQTGAWQPVVAWKTASDEARQALDFAPYPLLHLQAQGAELQECASISEAASLFFDALQTFGGHSALRSQVATDLAEIRSRDERKLFSLQEEWQRAQQLETLRRKGELLLAYMHTLQPGQRTLFIPDENLTVELPPGVTPVEYSQAIFKEYRKARSAVEGLPERIGEAEMRLAYMDDLATSLDLAVTYDEIKAVQAEVNMAGKPPTLPQETVGKKKARGRGRPPEARLPQPLRLQSHNGVQILVGRTASQNDTATFRLAGPDDLWFHARGVPGSHVILRAAPGRTGEDIQEAARLAAGYSKLREDAQVDVIYTEKKYVRKIPNAPPGQATYKNERVIRVAPLRRQSSSRKD